ncbi:hypothetical protein [Antarcticimicrobium luteum]|uniref:Uncharacterized protein n=1 Tax=Antarcticimicrobium luteum TaxID=2547397 RepID=A0A4R5V1U7_9RHOB|nr:hypothetical protein [Antarcticimicrobium luteum]TDK45742.1 hypothetical protein E1832_13880 [Antarcticimicrobium luteum]
MAGKEHAKTQSIPAGIHQISRLRSVIVELIGRVALHRPGLLSAGPVEDMMNGEDSTSLPPPERPVPAHR